MKIQCFGFIYAALVLLSLFVAVATAQPDSQMNSGGQYAKFSPSMAVIVVVLISALFFMGFFSIYIRHCSDSSGAAGSIGRALSLRARRAAAARGLDHAVLETFPTFSYAEVKDHKIGKGGGECAVCLNEFDGDETLRLLPKCDHVFHAECIDAWLESHVTCPVCRANLVPGEAAAEGGDSVPPPTETATVIDTTANVNIQTENTNNNEEIVIQVPDESQQPTAAPAPPRSLSVRRPYKLFSFGKFRSHSTGHSMVQPVENLDRFTLKLPEQVRKEVIDRAMLNRTRSLAVNLRGEGSSRTGYRSGGVNEGRRSYRRMEVPEQGGRSDRWDFFTRMLSMKSPKVGTEIGEGSNSKRSGGRTPVRMPSIKCLEPKVDSGDEEHLFSGDSRRSPV